MTAPTAHACARCSRPMAHDVALICAQDAALLRRHLGTVARIAGDIEAVIRRAAVIVRPGAGRPDEDGWESHAMALEPISAPVALDALAARDAVVGELGSWVRVIATERGIDPPTATTAGALGILAHWLTGHVEWLRHHPAADEAVIALLDACGQAQRIVDSRPDVWYAGPCTTDGCGEDLYPAAGAQAVTCRGCGEHYDADERKRWLLRQAEDIWGNATWLAATLSVLGMRCTDAMIRGYAHRGRLASHPEPDGRGHPRYRLGSVLEVLTDAMVARQRATRQRVPA